ncbi:MAG TPA: hypothetical protein VF230_10510 [Acidimicrobiales bacterium]
MALAAFFLLVGILATELAVVGFETAGFVGVAMFLLAVLTLFRLRSDDGDHRGGARTA